MNLDLGGPGAGCSAMRVRRLLSGELTGIEKERTEAHVASCPRCAAVQEEIAAEREALRRDVPFPQFAAAVAEKLAHRPHRSIAARWAPLTAAAAGLALVAGTLLVRRPAETDTVRSKEQVLEYLKGAFAFAHKSIATLTAQNQLENVKSPLLNS